MTLLHRFRRPRAALLAAPVLALALLTVVLAGPGHASTGSSCTGTVTAGKASGIQLRGSQIFAQRLTCGRARTVIGAYERRKLASDTCAADAENKGHAGCRADGYLCHTRGQLRSSHGRALHLESCKQDDRIITYTEADSDNG